MTVWCPNGIAEADPCLLRPTNLPAQPVILPSDAPQLSTNERGRGR